MKNETSQVSWTPPDRYWVKGNFDSAARGNPGPSGAGCVARDHQGQVIARCSQCLGVGTNNEAEVNAALLAVQMARKLGW